MNQTTAARAAGLTSINQLAAIRILAAGAETMTVIAGRLGISTAGVTTLADKFERLGLVTRIRGSKDRRSIWLKLTPAGTALAERLALPETATA